MFAIYYYYAGCLFLQLLDIIAYIRTYTQEIASYRIHFCECQSSLFAIRKQQETRIVQRHFDKSIFSTFDVNRFA